MAILMKEKQEKAYDALKAKFGYKNKMQAPKIKKVVVNTGIGSIKDQKKKNELVPDRLTKITGQKPVMKGAKQSISSFKVRQGDPVGYTATLRGKRMFDFLDKLVNVGFPRTRDFRGLSSKGIDEMGNYSIGIKEHIIFPETVDEEIKDVFGMTITIVTSSKEKNETKAFLEHLGFPLKKEESAK